MKKYVVFVLSAFLVFSMSVSGQNGKKNGTVAIDKRVEKMGTELSLNDTEKASLKNLFVKQEAEVTKLKAENAKSADLLAKVKELHNTQDAELKKAIGSEKYTRYKENRAAEKARVQAAKAE